MGRPKKDKIEWSGINPNSPDAKLIKDSIDATYSIIQDIEALRATLKENFDEISAKTGIPKRVWNALVKFNYFQNEHEAFAKSEELKQAYEALSQV